MSLRKRVSKLEDIQSPPPPPGDDEGERDFSFNPARILAFGGARDPAAREAAIAERRAELEEQGVKLHPNARAMPIAPNDHDNEIWLMASQAALIAEAD